MVEKRLRLLVIEDQDDDYDLLLRQLERTGYVVDATRVDDEPKLREALSQGPWDAIISDYSLPELDAPRALAVVAAANVDIPFIIVSGTVNEDTAVSAMRAGAHDFMSKNKLARLAPALEREIREAARRRETVRLREELLLSDRMASVGALAAGVAHEINNPLAAVLANLEFARTQLDAVEATGGAHAASLRATLDDACEAAERVRFIVRDLKVFSRASDETVSAVEVRDVLESSLRMARNEIRHRARLVCEYGDVPPVRGNDARLGQVFLNLIVNAAQAIPEGHAGENEIRIVTRYDGGAKVTIEFHDSGTGIPPDVASRIFDPFFTTKPIGTGTGLGLAICHRIVTSIDGEISVLPRDGGGTTFRVLLPIAGEPKPPTEQRSLPEGADGAEPAALPTRTKGKTSTVAIVDDDPMIASALKRILAGEHAVVVATPRELTHALELGERFDVVLCDLMMPDVTGYELYDRIVACAPEQVARVIFMTGGTVNDAASAFLARVSNPRIAKPFETQKLREMVRRIAIGAQSEPPR